MGCCESSSDNGLSTSYNLNASSPLTPDETRLFKQILTEIPIHCPQAIIDLPRRQFLDIYRYHIIASYHFRRMEFQLAVLYEIIGQVSAAIEGNQMALDMLLKHTPSNYQTISWKYSGLASCYLEGEAWGQAILHLRKAIEIARLSNEPNQEDIQLMENSLHLLTAKLMDGALMSMNHVLTPNPSQNQSNMESQITPGTIADNNICGTSSIDQAEVEHLPDKQTELLTNDETPKDVVLNLET
ncbi:unnamed protein product [Adineta steineri]|uniref:Uncharacterized protein n=1 Tax=Adineta steineri TaxID=433720 RepID=A0A816BNC6_9BILA|nr:unnamed protein product [Adineta steineri]CAF1611369.1 unnamed protein product [Adineta steineri]